MDATITDVERELLAAERESIDAQAAVEAAHERQQAAEARRAKAREALRAAPAPAAARKPGR